MYKCVRMYIWILIYRHAMYRISRMNFRGKWTTPPRLLRLVSTSKSISNLPGQSRDNRRYNLLLSTDGYIENRGSFVWWIKWKKRGKNFSKLIDRFAVQKSLWLSLFFFFKRDEKIRIQRAYVYIRVQGTREKNVNSDVGSTPRRGPGCTLNALYKCNMIIYPWKYTIAK